MKRLMCLILLAILLVSCGPINNNVAMVDGDAISLEEFEREYDIYKGINIKKYGEEALSKVQEGGETIENALRENLLDKMILDKLIEKDSIEKGISISEDEFNHSLNAYVEKLSGQENYQRFLSDNDISREFFEENTRKEALVEKHKETIENSFSASDDELLTFFEENKYQFEKADISYILVKTKDKAEEIINRYKSGTSFEDLAILESLDKVTAVDGGRLGFIKRNEYPSDFEYSAFSLEPGDISQPVEMEIGFYVIKLNDKLVEFSDLKEDVLSKYKEEMYKEYVTQLRDTADIQIYMGKLNE